MGVCISQDDSVQVAPLRGHVNNHPSTQREDFNQPSAPLGSSADEAGVSPTHRLKLLVKKRSDDSGWLRQHLNGMSFTSIMSGQLPPSVVGKPSSSEDTVTISVALLEAQMGERSRRPRSVASHGGDHSPPPCAATCATPSLEAPSGISAPPGLPEEMPLDLN